MTAHRSYAPGVNDQCTRPGAKRLAEIIRSYWSDRGVDVTVQLQDAGFTPVMRSSRTDIRSNMINGRPQTNTAPRVRRPSR